MLASPVGRDACEIAEKWGLAPHVADMLVLLELKAEQEFRDIRIPWLRWPGLFIVSGYRSPQLNKEVGGAKNSFHLNTDASGCPLSLAVDLRVGQVPGVSTFELWAILGGMWQRLGGRWGGSFSTPDPNHFDVPAFVSGRLPPLGI